jgi:hypothetical protein
VKIICTWATCFHMYSLENEYNEPPDWQTITSPFFG